MDSRRLPLVMFPNGSLARCEVVPEGCVFVVEPEPEEEEVITVVDQTEAVNGNESEMDTRGD